MNDQLTIETINLILESNRRKKLLIEKYAGCDYQLSRIIVADSRDAILQNQEELGYFASLLGKASNA